MSAAFYKHVSERFVFQPFCFFFEWATALFVIYPYTIFRKISNDYETKKKNNCRNVVECLNVGIGYPVRCVFAISISAHQFEQKKMMNNWRQFNELNTFVDLIQLRSFSKGNFFFVQCVPKLRRKDTKFQKLCCIAHTFHVSYDSSSWNRMSCRSNLSDSHLVPRNFLTKISQTLLEVFKTTAWISTM